MQKPKNIKKDKHFHFWKCREGKGYKQETNRYKISFRNFHKAAQGNTTKKILLIIILWKHSNGRKQENKKK
jgi:hypothetical protein